MRALVVGYGRMGKVHERELQALGASVTTVDPDPATFALWRTVKGSTVTRFEFEAVCIAVPIPVLAETAAEWAGYTGRLLIEKPGAHSIEAYERLCDALPSTRCAVGYAERFNPVARRMRDMGLGMEWRGAFTRSLGMGDAADVGLDLRSHDIDLARWLGLDPHECGFYNPATADKVRRVEARFGGLHVTGDLLAHKAHPVRSMWRNFLLGGRDYADLHSAGYVLRYLESEAKTHGGYDERAGSSVRAGAPAGAAGV